MRKNIQKFFSFLMALVMLLEAAPLSALAEEPQAADAPLAVDEAAPQKVEITLPEEYHVLAEGEYSVFPVDDLSAFAGLVEPPSGAPASAKRQAMGCAAYSIALNGGAVLADKYRVTVSVGADMLANADQELNPVFDGASFALYRVHADADGKQVSEPVGSFDVDQTSSLINSFSFDTAAFGTFVLTYAADCHFDGKNYCVKGSAQKLLSELIKEQEIMNGDVLLNIADVASVAFADERPVTVEQVSGLICYNEASGYDAGEKDFLLTSEMAFGGGEKLTLTLTDGTVLTVGEPPLVEGSYALRPNQTEIRVANQLYPLINLTDAEKTLSNWSSRGNETYPTVAIYDSRDQLVFDSGKGAADGCVYGVRITAEDEIITGVDELAAGDHITVRVYDSFAKAENGYVFIVTQDENAVPPVKAGETVVTAGVGSFAADAKVPGGTVLAVNQNPDVTDAQRAALRAMLNGGAQAGDSGSGKKQAKTRLFRGFSQSPADTETENAKAADNAALRSEPIFFEISLIGPDETEIQTGASVTLETNIALPQRDGMRTAVTNVAVYHFAENGGVEPLETTAYKTDEGKTITSVSFATPGFSLFAITYTVDFVYLTAKAEMTLDFSDYVLFGNNNNEIVHENENGITVIDISSFVNHNFPVF